MHPKLILRPVDDDGLCGKPIGTATLSGKVITYDGSPILADVLAGIVRRFKIDEPTAFARLVEDGWSNGKMVIASDAPSGREEGTMGARVDLNRLHNLAEAARARAQIQPQPRDPSGKSWYRIENKATASGDTTDTSAAEVYLFDMIGDWGVSAQDFVNDLRTVKATSIELHVNCEGGEVFDGLAIYETLRRHPADITAHVEGIAASAASFVVQAATKIVMAPRARMMIHDAHGVVMGNARDMREMANLLDDLSDTIADIYAERSGGTRAQWRTAMSAAEGGPDGSWYDAEAAVRAGLADEVQGKGGRPRAQLELRGEPGPELARVPVIPSEAEFDPSALLAVFSYVENPPAPVRIPAAEDLLELFKDR